MKGGITHGQYKDHTVKNSLWVNALRLLLCLSETAGDRVHARRLVAASPDISLRSGLEWMRQRATGYQFLSYFRCHLRAKDADQCCRCDGSDDAVNGIRSAAELYVMLPGH